MSQRRINTLDLALTGATESNPLNILTTIRQRQTPWARSVLGLFVVMWLNLALQPCVMAMGDPHDHDCPHCPPAQTRQLDGDHAHVHDKTDADGIISEIDQAAMPCASEPGGCGAFDGINTEARTAPLKLEDTPNDVPAAPLPFNLNSNSTHPLVHKDSLPTRRDTPGVPPPLNVLYCVYLD